MLNQWLYDLAVWVDGNQWSTDLHESYYMYNWIETAHVLTLMVSLGLLLIIDLRMLGVCFGNVPASRVAARLSVPMLLGFGAMFITGLLLYYAIPVRTTQSLWFRIKVVLIIAAGINAWLFHRQLNASVSSWDTDVRPPKRIRVAAALSLTLWIGTVFCGRAIAYDWYDCGKPHSDFINWAAGCLVDLHA